MMNEDATGTDMVMADITYLVYLKGRDEPVNFNATLQFSREHLHEGTELQNLMDLAASHVLGTIDIVREHRYILSDRRFNKGIFLTDEIQAISILAPDEDHLKNILEGDG